jgi:hypothetical protein
VFVHAILFKRWLLAISCWGCLSLSVASGIAADKLWSVTVQAGKIDRVNAPVCVPVKLPAGVDPSTAVELTDASGNKLRGQITGPSLLAAEGTSAELHFILPKLAAGQSASYAITKLTAVDASQPTFSWVDTSKAKGEEDVHAEQSRELRFGSRPVMRYMHTALDESSKDARMGTYKPYHHVYDPAGKRYLTKGPGGVFPHHRGLYLGFNRISYGEKQTADTWHCNGGEDESHKAFVSAEAGPVLGRHRMTIHWNGKKKDTFAVETREMTAYNTPHGTLIEFATKLESKVGPVKLDGDPQHAGFQFRATQDVPDKTAKQTYYLRPDGKAAPGKFRNWPADKQHVNLPWNALSIVVDDQRYTCCYLDRPENPKEARFSERDYGRFGSYFEYEMDTNKPLLLNYRIWLQAGEMEVAQVQQLDDDFTQKAAVKVE